MNKKRGMIVCVLALTLAFVFAFAACGGADVPTPPATPEYTVTFSVDGGSAVASQTVKEGSTAAEPESPAKEGFKFAGWYKEPSHTTLWVFSSDKVTADTTLHAKWIALYTVTFVTNGGGSISPQTAEDGSTVKKPADPSKTGYTFDGWYKDATFTLKWDFGVNKVTADTTLYAKWSANSHTVTFDSRGGSEVAAVQVEYGELLGKPAAPTKEGHTFAGWFKDAALTNEWNFQTDKVTADTALYAKWTVNSYTVTFDSNGGSEITAVQAEYGSLLTAPAVPAKEGYKFVGWYKDAALITEWNFGTDKVTADTALYAKWTANSYTVSFDSTGGSEVAAIEAEYGSLLTAPAAPAKEGHTFVGWYKDAALITEWNFETDKVTADTALYAKWTVNSYTATFDSNDGSEVAAVQAEYGSLLTRPADPVKEGFVFNGWCRDESCETQWIFATDKLTGDITLYAKWIDENAARYTVTFESSGGSEISALADVPANGMISAPAAPEKTGYRFDGWYKDAEFAAAWDFATDIVTGDVTLYAKWAAESYAVTFDANGGSDVAGTTADYDSLLTEPQAPERQGYKFGGWYKDAEITSAWDFAADKVTGELTLYAKWLELYTVTFVSNGGSAVDALTDVADGSKITAPAAPVRGHYVFAGWYTDDGSLLRCGSLTAMRSRAT